MRRRLLEPLVHLRGHQPPPEGDNMLVCVFPECAGHEDQLAALIHGQQAILARLVRIELAQHAHNQRTEQRMAQLDDDLTNLETAEAAEAASLDRLDADEQRELADLQALQAAHQPISDEQQARIDTLLAKMQSDQARIDAEDAAINTADPAPVETPPADAGATDAGATDAGTGDAGTTDGATSTDAGTDTPAA